MESYKPSDDNKLSSFIEEGFKSLNKDHDFYPSVVTPHNEHFQFYYKTIVETGEDKYYIILMFDEETKDAILRISFTKTFKEPRELNSDNITKMFGYGYPLSQIRFKIEL